MSAAMFSKLDLLYAELQRVRAEVRSNWGEIRKVHTAFGLHGVWYVEPDDDEENEGYAVIGFCLPDGFYAEIESETYGKLQGIRIYKEDD